MADTNTKSRITAGSIDDLFSDAPKPSSLRRLGFVHIVGLIEDHFGYLAFQHDTDIDVDERLPDTSAEEYPFSPEVLNKMLKQGRFYLVYARLNPPILSRTEMRSRDNKEYSLGSGDLYEEVQ